MSLHRASVFSNPSSTITVETPKCVDIICRRQDAIEDMAKALNQAGIKYRIHELYDCDIRCNQLYDCDIRYIPYDKLQSDFKSLYVIFLVNAWAEHYVYEVKRKLFSGDGQLGDFLNLLKQRPNNELYKRIYQAITMKDPHCQMEIVTHLTYCKENKKYQTFTEQPEKMGYPVTMRFITKNDWGSLAEICKAKLMPAQTCESVSSISNNK